MAELNDIIEKLKTKKEELAERLERVESSLRKTHDRDWAEQAQERENDEVVDAIGNETAQSIRSIQAALERIAAGTYGICDNCGQEIAAARLQVVPEATRCVNCAQ